MWAERGNEGGCGEHGQQASTLNAADFQGKDSRAIISTAQRAQETDHLHTEVKKIDCKEHIQPQREGTHTQIHKVSNQGRESSRPEVSKASADPLNVIIRRQRERRRLENSSRSEKTKRTLN